MATKNKLCVLILLLGFPVGYILHAQEKITVYPEEYQDALRNPMKGFRPDLSGAGEIDPE